MRHATRIRVRRRMEFGSDETWNFARAFADAPTPSELSLRFDRKRSHVVAHVAAAKRGESKRKANGNAHVPRWQWSDWQGARAKAQKQTSG